MKGKVLFILFSAVSCLALTESAFAGMWRPMGPFGDMVLSMAMAPDDPDVLFAGCNGGLFKSVDGGASWENASKVYKIYSFWSVSAARGGRDLVVGTDGAFYIYLSLDGGATWQKAAGPAGIDNPAINSVAIDPTSPDVVWACTNKGPYCSYDSGNDWVLRVDGLPDNFNAMFVRFHPADGCTYLCGRDQGIYRWDRVACTWSAVGPVQSLRVNDLAPHPQDADTLYACSASFGVFKTADAGATWMAKNAGLAEPQATLLAICPNDPRVLYCLGSGYNVYVWQDGAESWQCLNQGRKVAYGAKSLIASPVSGDTGYVATYVGVYVTTDRGATWQAASRGIVSATVVGMAFHPTQLGTLFVATEVAFFRTTDNGENWTVLSMGGDPKSCCANAVAIDPQDASTVYAATGKAQVIKSADGGDTWVELCDLSDHLALLALAIDPSDPQTIYVVTSKGEVLKSQDAGVTWADTGYPGGAKIGARALVIDPKDPAVLWAGSSWGAGRGTAYRSPDRGASWQKIVDHAVYAIAVSPVGPDTVYIGGSYGLVVARSDGAGGYTFQEDQPGLMDECVNSIDISPGDASIVYLGTGANGATSLFSGVYKSTDAGHSWKQLPCEGMVGRRCGYVAADPYIPTQVWAGFEGNALLKYSEEVGPPIQLSLSTNQSQYKAGDIQVARMSAQNSGGDINVDLYIAIMLPDSSLFFWPDFSPLMHPGYSMTPMIRGFSMTDVVFFNMVMPEGLPSGNYTWFGMFYDEASNNPASNLASAAWTFQP